jgi:hypothetical protein
MASSNGEGGPVMTDAPPDHLQVAAAAPPRVDAKYVWRFREISFPLSKFCVIS